MKRASRFWIVGIRAMACPPGAAHWFHTRPVYAQQSTQPPYYGGTFLISSYVDVDSNYNLYAESYMNVEVDFDEDIDAIEVDGYPDEDGSGVPCIACYADGDDNDPADLPLHAYAPVAPGHKYGLESDGWACQDDGEGQCGDREPVGYAYAFVNVANPARGKTGT